MDPGPRPRPTSPIPATNACGAGGLRTPTTHFHTCAHVSAGAAKTLAARALKAYTLCGLTHSRFPIHFYIG